MNDLDYLRKRAERMDSAPKGGDFSAEYNQRRWQRRVDETRAQRAQSPRQEGLAIPNATAPAYGDRFAGVPFLATPFDNVPDISAMTPDQLTLVKQKNAIAKLPEDVRRDLNTFALNYWSADTGGKRYDVTAAMGRLMDKGYDVKQIMQWADTIRRGENETKMEQTTAAAEENTERNPVWENVKRPFTQLSGSISGSLQGLGEYAGRKMFGSEYDSIDPNLEGYRSSVYAGTVAAKTKDKIRKMGGDKPNALGKAFGAIYGAGTSAVDSGLRLAVAGPTGSLVLAGMGSFQSGMREASQRGANEDQAFLFALGSGALEAATEKIPLDKLLKAPKPEAVKDLLIQAMGQGVSEATGEEINLAAGILWDAITMADKSAFNTEVRERMLNGEDRKDAVRHSMAGILEEVVNTGVESFLSGGMMEGVNGAFQMYGGKHTQNGTEPATEAPKPQETTSEGGTEPVAENIDNTIPFVEEVKAETAGQDNNVPANAAELGTDNNVATMQEDATPEVVPDVPEANVGNIEQAVETPAAPVYNDNIPGEIPGKTGVTTTLPNHYLDYHYVLAPADSVIVSHDEYGNPNPNYPSELQPRDRRRVDSQVQTVGMANDLDPTRIADSHDVHTGAPVVDRDGNVISGNQRSNAIKIAMKKGRKEQIGRYYKFLREHAEEFGLKPEDVKEGYMLIRVIDGDADLFQISRDANISQTSAYSATENAANDNEKIGDYIDLLDTGEDGDMMASSNQEFLTAFIDKVVPGTERGGVRNSDGSINKDGVTRATNAVFAYAYDDAGLVNALAEDTDPESKNILNALVSTAPAAVRVRRGAENGEMFDVGAVATVLKGVELYSESRRSNQSVSDFTSQMSLDTEWYPPETLIAEFLEKNKRSSKQVRMFLNSIYEQVEAAGDPTQGSMFGAEDVTIEDVMEGAKGKYEEKSGKVFPSRGGEGLFAESGSNAEEGPLTPRRSDVKSRKAVSGGNTAAESTGVPASETLTETVTDYGEQARRPDNLPDDQATSVGAADYGFVGETTMKYEDQLTDDNVQRTRPDDVRVFEVPKHDLNNRKVTETAGNIAGSNVIPDEATKVIEQLEVDGALGFDVTSNAESMQKAADYINEKGEAKVRGDISKSVANGTVKEGQIEQAMLLLAKYSRRNSKRAAENTAEIMADLASLGNAAGRHLQLFKILRRMTPGGQFLTVKKMAQREMDKYNLGKPEGKRKEVEIPKGLEDEFMDAVKEEQEAESKAKDEAKKKTEERVKKETEEDTKDAAKDAADEAVKEAEKKRRKKKPEPEVDDEAEAPEDEGPKFKKTKWKKGRFRNEKPGEISTYVEETGVSAYPVYGMKDGPEANISTNDLAEGIGDRVARNLAKNAADQKMSVEDFLFREIMSFANDKAPAPKGNAQKVTALDALGDYYRYHPFFQTAWDRARTRVEETLNQIPDDDPRAERLKDFLTTASIENTDLIARSFDYTNPKSVVRKGTKEAAQEAGIKMQNASQSEATVKAELEDVLLKNRQSKEAAAQKIADIVIERFGLDGQAAQEVAADVTNAFYSDLAERAQARLDQMFTPKEITPAVKKTVAQKIEELYNLGAFSSEEYAGQISEYLFDEAGISISEDLARQYSEAASNKKAEIEKEIYKTVAAQMPGTLAEKWNAWRHISMLLTVPTQVRNIGGNTFMRPFAAVKRTIGAGLEKAAKVPQNERTKSILGFSKNAQRMVALAKADAKSADTQVLLEGNSKTDDQARGKIQEYRTIFKNKVLEKARTGLYKAMEWEDSIFKRREYSLSMASFLKARGYTAAQWEAGLIPADTMEAAREHAAVEALRATFNDRNAFSDLLSRRMRADKKGAKAVNFAVDSVLPFRKTPANVVVRIVDYSPVGLAKGLGNVAVNVKKGKVSAAEAIDQVAAGLTGSAAIAMGAALASGAFGIRLVGAEEDEDKKRTGRQPYALEIGDKSYTIDWAAPSNVPLFVGANIYNAVQNGGGDGVSALTAVLKGSAQAFEPLLELSMLSSINDLVQSASYAKDSEKVYSLLATAATSYIMQALPTLAGQFDQLGGNRQMIYAESNDPVIREVQKFLGRASKKLPGDFYQTDYVDAWGRTEKTNWAEALISPSYVNKIDSTAADDEIKRLNKSQDLNASPSLPGRSITIDGKEVILTAKQFDAIAKQQGQMSLKLVDELIKTGEYAQLTDKQRAQAIRSAYEYAREVARRDNLPDYKEMSSSWMEDVKKGDEVKTIMRRAIVAASGLSDARYDKAEAAGFSLPEMQKVSKKVSEWVSEVDGAKDRDTYEAIIDSVPKAQRDKWLSIYGMSDGRIENLNAVTVAGFTTDDFFDIWDAYKDVKNNGGKASEQATAWAVGLDDAVSKGEITQSQRQVLTDNFTFFAQSPATAGKYDDLHESGLSSDTAVKVKEFMNGIAKTVDKMKAIKSSGLSESEKLKVAGVYLSDEQSKDLQDITRANYPGGKRLKYDDYVKLYDIYQNTAHGRGKKEATIDRIMREYGFDYDVAEWIYKVYGTNQ